MNYRKTTILAATDLGGSGTKTIDINVAQAISRITLQWIVTKGANGMNSYCHKDISKIELVDGSDVLFSMDGGQAQALNIFNRRVQAANHGQEISANSQRSMYSIDFGRYLYDPELAMDPTRFRNPQLKVTYDEDVSDTSVTANSLEVFADIFDEKQISPQGFLMSKNVWGTSMGADGTKEYIDLPTDFPVRCMLIQGYYAGYEPWYSVEHAKLSEDNDKRIPFDINLEKYYQLRKSEDLPVIEQLTGYMHSATEFYVIPTDYYSIASVLNAGGSDLYYYVNSWQRGGKFSFTAEGSMPFMAMIYGWCPNHCFYFPFGMQDQVDDWYDVTNIGSLRLELEAGSAGTSGSGAVILQQLRKY